MEEILLEAELPMDKASVAAGVAAGAEPILGGSLSVVESFRSRSSCGWRSFLEDWL